MTLQEKRAKATATRAAEKDKPTIERLWELYTATKGQYVSYINDQANFRHFAPLHKRTPDNIRTHEVTAIAKALEEQGKKPQTVKNCLELLRRLINFGVKQELCTHPVTIRFHMPSIDNHKTECLTPAQGKTLMEVLDEEENQNLANLVRLALATGMRRGALLGLQWTDIDFIQNTITLRGETAKKGRTEHLPLTTTARTILENIAHSESTYVFPGKKWRERRRSAQIYAKNS